jgi:hypothetical protein
VNGKSSSSALITATQWQVDDQAHAWVREQGHLARLGNRGLQNADEKWRSHRATQAPRTATAWAANWRIWIANERPPVPDRPHLHALPGGAVLTPGATRAEAHMAALLAAVDELEESE